MSSTSQVNIIQKKEIASDTIELSFTRPNNFEFKAGQYIQLGIPKLLYPDPRGSSRVFSLASSPEESEVLRIAFRNTGSGYKKTLSELDKDSPLDLEGPLGFFTLPQGSSNVWHVFIAGGIGITPFMSMIRSAHGNSFKEPVTLLYANKDQNSAAYIEELHDIGRKHDLFTLKTIFGKITQQHISNFIHDTDSVLWWVVGPPPMVAEVNSVLMSQGVHSNAIRHEEFTGY